MMGEFPRTLLWDGPKPQVPSPILGPFPAIAGLAVHLLHPCISCGQAFASRHNLRSHWQKKVNHKPSKELDSLQPVPCQTLHLQSTGTIYFLVPADSQISNQFLQGGRLLPVKSGIGRLLDGLSPEPELTSFTTTRREQAANPYHKFRFEQWWQELDPPLEIKELKKLVQLPYNYLADDWNASDSLRNLGDYLYYYFTNKGALQHQSTFVICQKIGGQDGLLAHEHGWDDEDESTPSLQAPQKPFLSSLGSSAATKKYVSVMTSLLSAMLRQGKGDQMMHEDEDSFKPPISQARIHPQPKSLDHSSVVDAFYHDGIPLCSEERDAIQELWELLERDLKVQPSCNRDNPPMMPPPMMGVLQSTFKKLFFREWDEIPPLGSTTLSRFIIASAYNSDGSFVEPGVFTQTLAAIQWLIRFICLDLVVDGLYFRDYDSVDPVG
jgi:hypothetical protein